MRKRPSRGHFDGMHAVMEVIRHHKRFLVSSHLNPEGDALGSALALASLLKRLGKKAMVANEGGIPKSYRFFPRVAPVLSGPDPKGKVEVAMVVDVPLLSRTGTVEKLIKQIPVLVNIDHHVSNHRFAHINWVDPMAAAVGEMIYRLYRAFRVKPTRDEALCLYVSLVTDTGSFRYMNTTPAVHRMAAQLIATGVSPLRVSQVLYENRSSRDLRFLGDTLQGIRHTPDGKIAWLEVTNRMVKAHSPGPDVQDELVNFPRSIESAEIAFVVRETEEKGKIRASLRSKGNVDVDRLARRFGGGGHKAASGCTIEGTLLEARERLLKAARQALHLTRHPSR